MIDRIWEGPEAEGYEKGERTAFVEATRLSWEDAGLIRSRVRARRLYFGANERDVESVPDGFFADLCGDYRVCVETGPRNLALIAAKVPYNALLILRNILDIPDRDMTRIRYKFRTGGGLLVLRDGEFTDISELRDGMYKEDKVVYNRNER